MNKIIIHSGTRKILVSKQEQKIITEKKTASVERFYTGFFGAQFDGETSIGNILRTTKSGGNTTKQWAYGVTWNNRKNLVYN